MTTEVIEGEAVEVDAPARALVPVQPGQVIVTDTTPQDMLERASAIATALARMIEAQKLFKKIGDKKYPFVEAWMTVGRMDNVVAREAGLPVQHDDGSWEAIVELVRLSDGMVIGNGSALCGAKGDNPWDGRPAHQRRSMAVTRATSRAFRQQYSWIMALAGYEPTPADEMPDDRGETHGPEPERDHERDGFIGTVAKGKNPVDMELRQTPDGSAWGFKLTEGRRGYQALAIGPLADALSVAGVEVGSTVTVWGPVQMVPWRKDDKDMPPYARILIEKIHTPEYVLPAPPGDQPAGVETPEPVAPGQETAFDLSEAALS